MRWETASEAQSLYKFPPHLEERRITGHPLSLGHDPEQETFPVESRAWTSGAWPCRRIENGSLASSSDIEAVTEHEGWGGLIKMVTLFLTMARKLAISHPVFALHWDFASRLEVRRAPL